MRLIPVSAWLLPFASLIVAISSEKSPFLVTLAVVARLCDLIVTFHLQNESVAETLRVLLFASSAATSAIFVCK